MPPRHRGATLHEDLLPGGCPAQFAQLPAVQLQHSQRLRTAPALQQDQHREQFRRRRRAQIKLHPDGDRVPCRSGEEVGRQVDPEHRASQQRARAGRKSLLVRRPVRWEKFPAEQQENLFTK